MRRFICTTLLLAAFAVAANDYCTAAKTIEPSSLPFEEKRSNVPQNKSIVLLENGNSLYFKGVHYRLNMGEEDGTVININLCNTLTLLDSSIFVETFCDPMTHSLDEIQGLRVSYNDDYCDRQSFTSFVAHKNTTYYIFISGATEHMTGDFMVQISRGQKTNNDVCDKEIKVDNFPYSALALTDDILISPNPCISNEDKGVWYQLVGTGDEMVVSTCNFATNFRTRVSVFSGECGALTCVVSSIELCASDPSRARAIFKTSVGVVYHIKVSGREDDHGQVNVDIRKMIEYTNDICDRAHNLKDIPTTFTLTHTKNTEVWTPCFNGTNSGLWYSIAGTGANMTFSTCSADLQQKSVRTTLEVYEESCPTRDSKLCYEKNVLYCDQNAEVRFHAKNSKNYYIFLTLPLGESISASVYAGAKANDQCHSSATITQMPFATSDSTWSSAKSEIYCDASKKARYGRYYRYLNIDTAKILRVEVTSKTQMTIEVHKGCGNHNCLPIAGDTAIEFGVEKDQVYNIFVSSDEGNRGDFHVKMTDITSVDTNLNCESALKVTVPFTRKFIVPNKLSASPCSASQMNGHWFSFVGDGNRITVDTCDDQTEVGTYVDIVEGCSPAKCLEYDHNGTCGFGRGRRTVISEMGKVYNVFVAGLTMGGIYRLKLYHFDEPPVNTLCPAAIEMRVNSTSLVYTKNAKSTVATCAPGEFQGAKKAVYYKFTAASADMHILSTCDDDTTFITEMSVFSACPSNESYRSYCVLFSTYEHCTGRAVTIVNPAPGRTYFVQLSGIDARSGGIAKLRLWTVHVNQTSSSSKKTPKMETSTLVIIICCSVGGGIFIIALAAGIGGIVYVKVIRPKRRGYTVLSQKGEDGTK